MIDLNSVLLARIAPLSLSGAFVDVPVPASASYVAVVYSALSTSGSAGLLFQLGTTGSVETTGYAGSSLGSLDVSSAVANTVTNGISPNEGGGGTYIRHGLLELYSLGSNLWLCRLTTSNSDVQRWASAVISKSLSGTLSRVRITTGNGTDTFDGGSVTAFFQ